ncbi:MAG: hypothetical protein SGARI_005186, partial [Bacillariaceae sp.]
MEVIINDETYETAARSTSGGSRYVLKQNKGYDDTDDASDDMVPVEDISDENSMDDGGKRKKRCKTWTIVGLVCLNLMVVAFFIVAIVNFKKTNDANREYGQFSQTSASNDILGSGCVVTQDIHSPKLEFFLQITEPVSTLSPGEAKDMGAAIVEGYNSASLGCNGDTYNRFMYECALTHQALTEYYSANGPVHTLDAVFTCKVSCDGCTAETAFADEFPVSDGRRELQSTLSAKSIMAEIESRMDGTADFDSVIGVSITTDGSSVKSMTSSEWAPQVVDG